MTGVAAVLGVYLFDPEGNRNRVGVLTRDRDRATAFVVDEVYLRNPERPTLSLSWLVPGDEATTRARLAARGDKIGLHGHLPPWFSGLLPEGALRDLVITEMGPGNHDQFDLLTRLGADLPGAILIAPETDTPASAGPLRLESVQGLDLVRPEGMVKFSLAGVQLKFAAVAIGNRLTVPARAGESRCILKVPTARYPGLPEAEFAAMTLCRMIGVNTADCRLISTDAVEAIPKAFLKEGKQAFVADRFDRPGGNKRIHMEDAAQIVGATGERKYTMATYETVLNMIRRFSTDWRADVFEGLRRIVADILIGNGDNHLKNWSFWFPHNREIRLSPAYDIVPTIFFAPNDNLALRFAGTHTFANVTFKRFRRVADFLKLDPDWIEREMKAVVETALDQWPRASFDLLDEARATLLLKRLDTLAVVQETRG
ncbi:type II toxin-antitoxin system HipA family toxin [Mesorhizobium sp.]|uniref:type II toxin-antitoxin system HipA family toxin n=1 Tax=Mesorhizobium sp. TaxID=1871066 RepID=UPI001225D6D2|nr:type II toxin-antitoxin system HipA family toxin [Mesorhizobium sp.]TIO04827.1 MAG: type II toxin-antitoxin system HipA family toxin [Mesorhizobium sp.]TIO34658.1 MAG: type II toxin-antitoxin system HipA family toxin [Mesorhizobium sp.]TIP14453.1 MAG: type II toxin-antitoxin system HipA family toxin [Mesorhizobium sp.]